MMIIMKLNNKKIAIIIKNEETEYTTWLTLSAEKTINFTLVQVIN